MPRTSKWFSFGVLDSENPINDRDDVIIVEGRGDTVNSENVGNLHNRYGHKHSGDNVGRNLNDMKTAGRNVTHSATYLASNPDKKKKANKQQVGSVEVVLTMDASAPTIVNHVPTMTFGSHVAVWIMEKIHDGVTTHSKDIKGHHLSVENNGGLARKGLRVKKSGNIGKGGLGIVELVKITHAWIDVIGEQTNGESIAASFAMDTSLGTYHSSDEEEAWEED
ncbi:hypothetical protein V6N11_010427 [Hibiscus sabdariffa]|uniref:Uncharacterized protein n=1 Tax=Hibiscus sabdariffa TaxID=183260 RepID=A0ABR2S586_9ROSI